MHLLYDDRELIKQLRLELSTLKALNITLLNQLEALKDSFAKLAAVAKPQPPAKQPVTQASIAQRLGVPVSMLPDIDLERLGIQAPTEERPLGKR